MVVTSQFAGETEWEAIKTMKGGLSRLEFIGPRVRKITLKRIVEPELDYSNIIVNKTSDNLIEDTKHIINYKAIKDS